MSSFEAVSLDGVRVELVDCGSASATVRVHRGPALLGTRVVELDDAPESVRPRLLAYVVAEILLAEDTTTPAPAAEATTTPTESTEPVQIVAPVLTRDESMDLPRLDPRNQHLRPWHISLDAGVRWLAASQTHVGTYRLTSSIGRMLFELRHTFGPLLGQPVLNDLRDQTVIFQSITVGIGFRYRHPFGDDAFFVDGVGAAGFLFLQRFDRNDGSFTERTRFATAGLEARAGIEIGLGRLRGSIAAEFGYTRPRNGPKADFDPPPEIRHASGVFLGMTLGLGWETASGLRGTSLRGRRRMLGADPSRTRSTNP